MSENSSDKVPLVDPSWVDDMVMSQALYSAIKEINPLLKISALAGSSLRPLLEQILGVDETLISDFAHSDLRLSKIKSFWKNFRDRNLNRTFILAVTNSKKLISTDIECQPYFKGERLFGHLHCLTEIKSERVFEAITFFGQDVR